MSKANVREVWVREIAHNGRPLKAALTRRGAESPSVEHRVTRYVPEGVILADYHELLSAMAYLHSLKGHAGTDIMTPEKILAWAEERGWKL